MLSIFKPDDVEVTASQMPNNSAADLLLLEDRWAIPLFIKGSHLERRGRSQGWRPGGSGSGPDDRGRNRREAAGKKQQDVVDRWQDVFGAKNEDEEDDDEGGAVPV